MTWFYRVLYHIMTPNTLGKSHRLANHEVLEAKDNHTKDVSAVCWRIVEIRHRSLTFVDGSLQLTLIEDMIDEAQNALQ